MLRSVRFSRGMSGLKSVGLNYKDEMRAMMQEQELQQSMSKLQQLAMGGQISEQTSFKLGAPLREDGFARQIRPISIASSELGGAGHRSATYTSAASLKNR